MNKPRLLKAEEIEVRIGTINEKGATLLLYKDARVDQHLLDETFGAENWQRDHKELKGNIYAGVSVWDDEKSQWVTKWDAGTESQTEKVKGEASDSFKRACVNWGIGRELYTAPFTWIPADSYNGFINGKTPQGKDRYATYDKFIVKKIGYNDQREINELVIENTKTHKVVFTLGKQESTLKTREDGHDAEILARAKADINKALESLDYTTVDQKKTFITMVLGKATIDTQEDVDLVQDAIMNEK